ncbi:MAG: PadR family transcriptional regulator, partial [Oscillospiraceae bacterium]|nr:PadR family transcriptional regulator [Oscillospiraceae bacterium]
TPVKGRGGDKKIYSITDNGREELIRWLRETRDESVRSSLLMTTFFRGELPREENIRYFETLSAFSEKALDEMQKPDENSRVYSEMMGTTDKALYWQMTVEYGKMYAKMMQEWAEKCLYMIKGES